MFDHDFEEADECAECGAPERAKHHNESNKEDYDHDYDESDPVCEICGMNEAEDHHQTEE